MQILYGLNWSHFYFQNYLFAYQYNICPKLDNVGKTKNLDKK